MPNNSEIQALQQSVEKQVQQGQINDRQQRDSLYMEAAAPQIAVGRLANEFHAAGSIRATTTEGLGGSSYTDQLIQRRDSEAASRMPRSSGSWEKEQTRPGSWQSGVGALKTVGEGASTAIGQGRPLFKQGD